VIYDMEDWRAVVNTLMNVSVPKNSVNFVIRRRCIILSRRAVFVGLVNYS